MFLQQHIPECFIPIIPQQFISNYKFKVHTVKKITFFFYPFIAIFNDVEDSLKFKEVKTFSCLKKETKEKKIPIELQL